MFDANKPAETLANTDKTLSIVRFGVQSSLAGR